MSESLSSRPPASAERIPPLDSQGIKALRENFDAVLERSGITTQCSETRELLLEEYVATLRNKMDPLYSGEKIEFFYPDGSEISIGTMGDGSRYINFSNLTHEQARRFNLQEDMTMGYITDQAIVHRVAAQLQLDKQNLSLREHGLESIHRVSHKEGVN